MKILKKLIFSLFSMSIFFSSIAYSEIDPCGYSIDDDLTTVKSEPKMMLKVKNRIINVKWEDNVSVAAIRSAVKNRPIKIKMKGYAGIEQYGPLGKTFVTNDQKITTEPGDIVLYGGSNIVLFYGSNTWEYTKLGKMQCLNQEDLTYMLSKDDVEITLYWKY